MCPLTPPRPSLSSLFKGLGILFCIPAPQIDFLKCGVDVWQLGTLSRFPGPEWGDSSAPSEGVSGSGCWYNVVN